MKRLLLGSLLSCMLVGQISCNTLGDNPNFQAFAYGILAPTIGMTVGSYLPKIQNSAIKTRASYALGLAGLGGIAMAFSTSDTKLIARYAVGACVGFYGILGLWAASSK